MRIEFHFKEVIRYRLRIIVYNMLKYNGEETLKGKPIAKRNSHDMNCSS